MDYGGTNVWSDEHWQRVRKAVQEEAHRARVAAQFLPLFGPVDPAAVSIPVLRLSYPDNPGGPTQDRMAVDSESSLRLTTISVLVYLHKREVADPELSAALTMFRRAANTIARVEDALLFNGRLTQDSVPLGISPVPRIFTVTGAGGVAGILPDLQDPEYPAPLDGRKHAPLPDPCDGDDLVSAIIHAIQELENSGQQGPFACVLSQRLFQTIVKPDGSIVLPRDRVLPFLEGPLLRSSVIASGYGTVIALGGEPIEVVVAQDISVDYLQLSAEPRHVFRVSERVALRVKDQSAIAMLIPQRAIDAGAVL